MATKKKLLEAAAGSAGGGAGLDVSEVFSTYLYKGTGSSQTITNGIDLSGEGGLVWIKGRQPSLMDHQLFDTERGALYRLQTSATDASGSLANTLTSFNSNGFTVGGESIVGQNNQDFASWTFRKAPRFFDCVTYTGDGTYARNISHNLTSKPGFIIIKKTSGAEHWYVSHRGQNSGYNTGFLSLTNAITNGTGTAIPIGYATDTTFRVSNTSGQSYANASGATYVAYLFAHNDGDGEFGPRGDQDIIKCGSFTTNSSGYGQDVNLGFEPQWLLIKRYDSSSGGDWKIIDTMRGYPVYEANNNATKRLEAEDNGAEATQIYGGILSQTGFKIQDNANATYIYVAIRRGPMGIPESGTDVFDVDVSVASQPYVVSTALNYVDMTINRDRSSSSAQAFIHNRMTGSKWMFTDSTQAESNSPNDVRYDFNGKVMPYFYTNGQSHVNLMWKRAPSFFDVVCWNTTSGATNRRINHNLGVAPEMVIFRRRDGTDHWYTYHKDVGTNNYVRVNTSAAQGGFTNCFNTATDTDWGYNESGFYAYANLPMIGYFFASLSGISKVGSYTGNGSTQTIDCGFSSGARFVLIKRTDSTGDWYVWDTERGIVAANDPHLSLNTTAAEVTTDDSIDPVSSGFSVNQVAATNINVSSATYIFYAVS